MVRERQIIKYEQPYVNGMLHGMYKTWYPNGQIMYKDPYVNDVKNGMFYSWDKNGSLLSKHMYDKGVKKCVNCAKEPKSSYAIVGVQNKSVPCKHTIRCDMCDMKVILNTSNCLICSDTS